MGRAKRYIISLILRNLNDDEAAIALVDSNLQRECILPSERAFAYKLKYDAQKRQGERTDLTSGHDVPKWEDFDKSDRQVRRYIRLTELVTPLLDKVDEKSIPVSAGTELSYLDVKAQETVNEFLDSEVCNVSEKQAKEIRASFEQENLSYEVLNKFLCGEIENEKFYLETKRLRSYFPKGYSLKECKEAVWKILDNWFKRKKGNIDDNNR